MLAGAFSGEKLSFLLKDELHFSASNFTTLGLVTGIPAYLRVFIGAGADGFLLFGYHRRTYYALSWTLMALAMLTLAIVPSHSAVTIAALLLVYAAGGNLLFVIMDAVLVQVGNATNTVGRLQSIQQGASVLLNLTFIGPLAGYVTQHWSYQACFIASSICAALGIGVTLLIDEQRVVRVDSADDLAAARGKRQLTLDALRLSARSGGLWLLVGYVFYLLVTPGTATAHFYYNVDALHLSKQTIGNLRVPGAAGALLGIVAFGFISRRLPVRVLVWTALAMDAVQYVVLFALVDTRTAYALAFVGGLIGYIYTLSLITLAARACPPRIEATVYGLFLGAQTLGFTVSEKIGSSIYDAYGPKRGFSLAHGWHVLLWAGFLTTLLAVALIPFLPSWTKSNEPLRNTGRRADGVLA